MYVQFPETCMLILSLKQKFPQEYKLNSVKVSTLFFQAWQSQLVLVVKNLVTLFQVKIRELEETARREKEEWEQRIKEEEIKQERKKHDSATKIQSVYKGFR